MFTIWSLHHTLLGRFWSAVVSSFYLFWEDIWGSYLLKLDQSWNSSHQQFGPILEGSGKVQLKINVVVILDSCDMLFIMQYSFYRIQHKFSIITLLSKIYIHLSALNAEYYLFLKKCRHINHLIRTHQKNILANLILVINHGCA